MSLHKTLLATSSTPALSCFPAATRGVSVLSALHAYRVVFNAGVGEGRSDVLRRRRNSKQLLQPSRNLSPFFKRLLG